MRKSHFICRKVNPPQKQTGAALLLFILLLVLGASTLLVSKLNKASIRSYWENYTGLRLAEAKQALLGRSASDNNRPGSLPCPDTDGDGSAELFAGDQCPSYTGFFPWRTLDIEELRDGTGSPIWYSLQPTLRDHNNAQPINSEILGELTLDNDAGTGWTDIVAVIIAPGEAFSSQDRLTAPLAIGSYLEDSNSDGDQDFLTMTASGEFNDTVIAITRQELMTVTEKRVLGEITNSLNDYYFANGGGYPWLSPFENPLTSDFNGEINIREGHLPLHIQNGWFVTPFTIDWNISGGSTPVSDGFVTDDILNGIGVGAIIVDQPSIIYGSTTGASECQWTVIKNPPPTTAKENITCRGSVTEPLAGGFQRIYDFEVTFDQGIVVINLPDSTSVRTRDVINPLDGSSSIIDIKITIKDNSAGFEETGTNSIGTSAAGLLVVSDVSYNLDPVLDAITSTVEIPAWVPDNNWHHLVYAAYSDSDKPGSVTSCDGVPNCLSLANTAPVNNKRGLLISAGIDISGNRTSNPGVWNNYFEDTVHSLPPAANDLFEKNTITATYNDQVKVLDTAP